MDKSIKYLRKMFGNNAAFRTGQEEAINMALKNKRVLIVQKTGWGKSIIYFIAAKMLRDQGKGTTLLISPLISLMANQIDNAKKIGVKAVTINSSNQEDHDEVIRKISKGDVDIILISPERLANQSMMNRIFDALHRGVGMFVVDEAHCISDWGHDFRPDYRRIVNIVNSLPPTVPVLATTATANDRVVDDIKSQLGKIEVVRGDLLRESLSLQSIKLDTQPERLAWMAENIPNIKGSGIVYCLTIRDTEKVALWLQSKGIDARAYHSKLSDEEKYENEKMFMDNNIKVLCATVALGMGYDKPDIGFVIHYQRPGNIVSYYQQIGRAGRALDQAYIILLNGYEDDKIIDYFIKQAFPLEREIKMILDIIGYEELKASEILNRVNAKKGRVDKCLKYLVIEGVLNKEKSKYYRSPNNYSVDTKKSDDITKMRYSELEDIKEFAKGNCCYMEYIGEKLDDKNAKPCGKCSFCLGEDIFPTSVSKKLYKEAYDFIRKQYLEILPRKQWPYSMGMKPFKFEKTLEIGRTLCEYGDAGYGRDLHDAKYVDVHFDDEIVDASVNLIKKWLPKYKNMNITYVPSQLRPNLVKSFAERVSKKLGIPCCDVLYKNENIKEQKFMENSNYQCKNALDGFGINDVNLNGDYILIDDMVDSKWTLTVCGFLLLTNGAAKVYPFAIASTAVQSGE